jgi:hypothetical protein
MSFDVDFSNNDNQTFQSDESATDKPLFIETDAAATNEPDVQGIEVQFNSSEM